ncbi:MAG: hypothetical protein LR011_03560 [Verrucomicrobia bacterium]|nr:hypothetical protein [Verrucomicrobiota bacterium]
MNLQVRKLMNAMVVAILMNVSGGYSADEVAHGRVFHDLNGNGRYDDGEPGLTCSMSRVRLCS